MKNGSIGDSGTSQNIGRTLAAHRLAVNRIAVESAR
jgi:hypothetical protein